MEVESRSLLRAHFYGPTKELVTAVDIRLLTPAPAIKDEEIKMIQ